MKEPLADFIRTSLKNPKEEEIKEILQIFHLKEFAKGEHFKQHDQICKQIAFILKGSARNYMLKKNGNEITARIARQNDFITDIVSVRTQAITPLSIEILEPTTLLVAETKDSIALLETNLTFNRIVREYMAQNTVYMGKMYMHFLAGTARERYEFIIQNNPALLKKTPLRFIASMIGITPTQLSRIRKKKRLKTPE